MSDLQRLMDTDPHELTRENIDSIIEQYRAARASFNIKTPKAPKEPKAPKTPAKPILEILDDLPLLRPKQ